VEVLVIIVVLIWVIAKLSGPSDGNSNTEESRLSEKPTHNRERAADSQPSDGLNTPATLVGIRHYGGALPVGCPIQLRHEPTNPYDANAIAAYVGDVKRGHLPKELAARLAPTLGERSFSGVVTGHSDGYKQPIRFSTTPCPVEEGGGRASPSPFDGTDSTQRDGRQNDHSHPEPVTVAGLATEYRSPSKQMVDRPGHVGVAPTTRPEEIRGRDGVTRTVTRRVGGQPLSHDSQTHRPPEMRSGHTIVARAPIGSSGSTDLAQGHDLIPYWEPYPGAYPDPEDPDLAQTYDYYHSDDGDDDDS